MKKIFFSFLLAVVTSIAISSCTEENIRPQDGGGQAGDPCQFGGPNCK